MKAGEVQIVMAEAMLVSPYVVKVAMRNIREDGLLTTGAHGVNAPDQTYLDTSRVLISLIVESNPGRRAPRHVRQFGALPWANRDFAWEGDPFTLASLLPGFVPNTFEEGLAGLIQVFAECADYPAFREAGTEMRDGSFNLPRCDVEIALEDEAATVSMAGAPYTFAAPVSLSSWDRSKDERTRLGRQAIAKVNQEVVARIATGFREAK